EEGRPVPVPDQAPIWTYVEPPADFTAVEETGPAVILSWRNPFDAMYDFVHVYRGSTSDFEGASNIGFHGGALGELVSYIDDAPGVTPHYWLVSVDRLGRASMPIGPRVPT